MNIDQVKTVLELNRTRHFKKTAQAMFVTQSTISARLHALELELDCKLFDRTSRTIEITPEGEKFIAHAQSMLALWRRAKQEIHSKDSEEAHLAIGGLFVTWDLFLQSWLERLHQDYPTLTLTTEAHDNAYLLKQLLDGALDLIFIFEPPKTSDVLFQKILEMELILVSSQKNQTLDKAIQENYFLVDWGEQFLVEHTRVLSDYTLPKRRTNQARIALNFLLSTGGAAFLPRQIVEPYLLNKTLFKVKKVDSINLQINAVYMKNCFNLDFVKQSLTYL